MNTHKTAARIFGVLFLISFLAYGTGTGVIQSIVSAPDILSNVYASTTLIVVSAILMGVVHTVTNIGMPVVLRPVLKPHNETLYLGYLSAAIVATVTLLVGVIFLLLLIPLSDAFMRSGSAVTGQYETMAILLREANYYSYNIGMAIWSLGGIDVLLHSVSVQAHPATHVGMGCCGIYGLPIGQHSGDIRTGLWLDSYCAGSLIRSLSKLMAHRERIQSIRVRFRACQPR
jgi:hypothetical protein